MSDDLECKTQPIKVEHRGIRRFIPYCAGVGYGGVITEGARECKARDCFNYRELNIPDEPMAWEER